MSFMRIDDERLAQFAFTGDAPLMTPLSRPRSDHAVLQCRASSSSARPHAAVDASRAHYGGQEVQGAARAPLVLFYSADFPLCDTEESATQAQPPILSVAADHLSIFDADARPRDTAPSAATFTAVTPPLPIAMPAAEDSPPEVLSC